MIDSKISPGLLPLSFVKGELVKFPRIQAIRSHDGFYERKNIWAGYIDEDEVVLIDTTVSPQLICKAINSRFQGFNLEPSEAWFYLFAHECAHSECRGDEWAASKYGRETILRMRTEREQFYQSIRDAAARAMKAAIHEAFRDRRMKGTVY